MADKTATFDNVMGITITTVVTQYADTFETEAGITVNTPVYQIFSASHPVEMGITQALSAYKIQVADFPTAIGISNAMSCLASYIVSFATEAGIRIDSVATNGRPGVDSEARTWAVNLDTGAASQYDNFGFYKLFVRDGQCFGLADDGIYLLDGDKDEGWEIQTLVDPGKNNFGERRMKKIGDVYAGVSSTGAAYMKAYADDKEYRYKFNNLSGTLRDRKVKFGQNVPANYWNTSVVNADEFESIELKIIPVDRSR